MKVESKINEFKGGNSHPYLKNGVGDKNHAFGDEEYSEMFWSCTGFERCFPQCR